MSKFNVGDRVRRIPGGSRILPSGVEGVVRDVFDSQIRIVGMGPYFEDRYFELVERAPIGDPDDSPVEHPKHYNSHPSGVECITIARHHNFNIGNAFKYLWRIGLKGEDAATKQKRVQEIDKAIFYLQDERARILA